MDTGYFLTAIIGTVASFALGCIWYSLIWGKVWQKEMGFSDDDIKKIFVPKRIFLAFFSEWMATFCLVGILLNLPILMLYKLLMLASVIIFSSVKLAVFDGKNWKIILINQGYNLLSLLIIAGLSLIFI
ncbi:DUF1761 domain-containing protein [Culicoidibacter larvae]|uniref:DUF1761 domain-containing protein n=1 Tax=Culicoidibacter larvae TaxID=2579976 RepID=UPI0014855B76|nr:DUF1761 domain-containing protein [Culicoidibacter larvae]